MTAWILYCALLTGDAQLPKVCDRAYASAVECSQAINTVDDRIAHYCSKKVERCDYEHSLVIYPVEREPGWVPRGKTTSRACRLDEYQDQQSPHPEDFGSGFDLGYQTPDLQ